MDFVTAQAIPATMIFGVSVALTAMALWFAGRLTPWFLQEAIDPPSLRSFFFDPFADTELTRARAAMVGLATAIVLAVLLAFAVTARMMGWAPAHPL